MPRLYHFTDAPHEYTVIHPVGDEGQPGGSGDNASSEEGEEGEEAGRYQGEEEGEEDEEEGSVESGASAGGANDLAALGDALPLRAAKQPAAERVGGQDAVQQPQVAPQQGVQQRQERQQQEMQRVQRQQRRQQGGVRGGHAAGPSSPPQADEASEGLPQRLEQLLWAGAGVEAEQAAGAGGGQGAGPPRSQQQQEVTQQAPAEAAPRPQLSAGVWARLRRRGDVLCSAGILWDVAAYECSAELAARKLAITRCNVRDVSQQQGTNRLLFIGTDSTPKAQACGYIQAEIEGAWSVVVPGPFTLREALHQHLDKPGELAKARDLADKEKDFLLCRVAARLGGMWVVDASSGQVVPLGGLHHVWAIGMDNTAGGPFSHSVVWLARDAGNSKAAPLVRCEVQWRKSREAKQLTGDLLYFVRDFSPRASAALLLALAEWVRSQMGDEAADLLLHHGARLSLGTFVFLGKVGAEWRTVRRELLLEVPCPDPGFQGRVAAAISAGNSPHSVLPTAGHTVQLRWGDPAQAAPAEARMWAVADSRPPAGNPQQARLWRIRRPLTAVLRGRGDSTAAFL